MNAHELAEMIDAIDLEHERERRLAPCPFCGCDRVDQVGAVILCHGCSALTQFTAHTAHTERLWNMRHPPIIELSELVDRITDENRHDEVGVTPMGSTRWR